MCKSFLLFYYLLSKLCFPDRKSLMKNGCVSGVYVTTVFLLDTSASMAGTGLEQMKTAFKDIIYGY